MDWVAESKPDGSRVHSIVEGYMVAEPYSDSLETVNVLAKGPADGQHRNTQH
jgi:hypothetical protein